MKKCPLCEKDTTTLHRRSHLLPEWMYSEVYDSRHKLINVKVDRRHVNKKQKGYYETIICETCEIESQVYDRYGSLILGNKNAQAPEVASIVVAQRSGHTSTGDQHYSHWQNVDFCKLQKFVYACVLRSHLAEQKEGNYLLVDKHFKRMRELYRNPQCKDDSTYPVQVVKFIDADTTKNLIYLPFRNKIDGHSVVEFAGGGYMFRVFVSSHRKPSHVTEVMLNASGSLYMLHFSIKDVGTFKSTLPVLVELAKKFPDP
ncbi:hypothetical protein [Geobacter sp. AOG1]|uniref:hypothetical protein n=1 Tax=Geobacter sp. AOG1 TaxID=1566346 RepID=UPI001CC70564|nr:hypothetical protein [Geobacter sp. AOG1]GFE57352.1 hypothetical protein AOG1_12320 [Geobacter sp. AOG1]